MCAKLNDNGVHPQKKALFSEMSETSIKTSNKTTKAMMKVGTGLNESIIFLRFFSGFHFYDYNDLLRKGNKNEIRRVATGVCMPFSRSIYMTINGNLYPCERIGSCFAMGNIHDKSVLDAEQIASRYHQYFENILPTCTACEKKLLCDQCLFYIDEVQGSKPHCNKMINQEQFNEMVASSISIYKKYPSLYRTIIKRTTFT